MEQLTSYLNAERGRRTKLAAALGISQSAISMWSRVPVERVASISKITGIPKHQLRPDIFEPPAISLAVPPPAGQLGAEADEASAPSFSGRINT